MGNIFKNVIAAIVGGGGFLIFLFKLQSSVTVAIVVGIISYIAISLMFAKSPKNQSINPVNLPRNELAEGVVQEAEEKLNKIRYFGSKIANRNVKAKVEAICTLATKIFEDIRKDPRDVKPAKKFLGYYLDATANILEKYLDISEKQLESVEINARLRKSEETLEMIRSAFERQLAKLIENDILDLDSEISVLQNTLKMEDM